MPAEKLDPGGNADTGLYGNNRKRRFFEARTDREHDNIYKTRGRNSGRATSCISSAFVKMVALGAGKLDVIG
jgi:hypothetical protein